MEVQGVEREIEKWRGGLRMEERMCVFTRDERKKRRKAGQIWGN
jgi:hypothetical protein